MTWYNINPDDDKAQVDGLAITASSTNYDGGSSIALGGSLPVDTALTDFLQLGGRAEVHGSQVVQGANVFGVFQTAPTAITSVAADSFDLASYTLAGHGLTVGTTISVTGSTNGNLDGVQKIVQVPNANTFVTEKAYVASASAGSYTEVSGRFASMTAEEYIMLAYVSTVAGGEATRTGFGSDYGIRRSIHKLEHMWSRLVATAIRAGNWNIYTSSFSTDPTVQDDVIQAPNFGTDDAANPTRLIPGELTYRTSGQQDGSSGFGVTEDDYEQKNS